MSIYTPEYWEATKRGAASMLIDLDLQRKQLEKIIASCNKKLANGNGEPHHTEKADASPAVTVEPRKRKKMSAAARRKIGLRMKQYWAAKRKAGQ